jgi:uncharacterized small protein (DUF1192 family)
VYRSPEYVKELEGYLREKTAEIERLRAENEGLRGNLKGNPVLSTFDGIANLQAEVERLRASLEEIAAMKEQVCIEVQTHAIARKALEGNA